MTGNADGYDEGDLQGSPSCHCTCVWIQAFAIWLLRFMPYS